MSRLLKEYIKSILKESSSSRESVIHNLNILVSTVESLQKQGFISRSVQIFSSNIISLILSNIDSNHDEIKMILKSLEYYTSNPDLDDYDYPNEYNILKDIASSNNISEPNQTIYRGISLDRKIVEDISMAGSSFNHGDISSWSFDKNVAVDFASEAYDINVNVKRLPNQVMVIFGCSNPHRGSFIGPISRFRDQQEVLSSGKTTTTKSYNTRESFTDVDGSKELYDILYIECTQS